MHSPGVVRKTKAINPNKTVVIPFIRKRNIEGFTEPILFGKRIQLSSEVKYLGIIRDNGLTWKKQLIWPTRPSGEQRHIWENLGTETIGGILDIHSGGNTHTNICCHYVVAQS
jgi:hypothetical protein